jgi:predicted PurR-regulated permease PerM
MIASRKSSRVQSPRVVIPAGLERATQWSWRLLLIAAAITLGLFVVAQLSFLIIPLFIAVLLAALVAPVSVGLRKLRFPRWLATLTTIIVFLAAVGGLFYLVINEVIRGWESLQARTILAYDDFVQYLLDSPLQVTEAQLNEWVTALATEFNIDSSWILSGALSVTSSVGSWLVGAGIAIFALIFFIHDGARIWEYVVSWFPKLARPPSWGLPARAGTP